MKRQDSKNPNEFVKQRGGSMQMRTHLHSQRPYGHSDRRDGTTHVELHYMKNCHSHQVGHNQSQLPPHTLPLPFVGAAPAAPRGGVCGRPVDSPP